MLLGIFALGITAILSPLFVHDDVYAQNDPRILLSIAIEADQQIKTQLDYVYDSDVPEDIWELYLQGHEAVVSLESSSVSGDTQQIDQDFLDAMTSFKQITAIISGFNGDDEEYEGQEESYNRSNISANKMNPEADYSNTGERDENYAQQESAQVTTAVMVMEHETSSRDPTSQLNRLSKYFNNLKTISEKYDTEIDFSEIESLFAQAHQQLDSNQVDAAITTIQHLESLIDAIKKNIDQHAARFAFDRLKEFTSSHLDKIKIMLNKTTNTNPSLPELETANILVQDIEILLLEDNIPDAKEKFLKLVKLVKMINGSSSTT